MKMGFRGVGGWPLKLERNAEAHSEVRPQLPVVLEVEVVLAVAGVVLQQRAARQVRLEVVGRHETLLDAADSAPQILDGAAQPPDVGRADRQRAAGSGQAESLRATHHARA